MNIREYIASDKEQIIALFTALQGYISHIDPVKRKHLTSDFGKNYLLFVLQTISHNNGKLFVAEENGKIYGFIFGSVHSFSESEKLKQIDDKEGNVEELYVDASMRGKGIGRSLLTKLESYFHETDCDFITINVLEANESSKGFYEKHGYSTQARSYIKPIRK